MFAAKKSRGLPTTLAASDSDGGSATITFEWVIVHPDGTRFIEGKTPLQIEHQASHMLPSSTSEDDDTNDTK